MNAVFCMGSRPVELLFELETKGKRHNNKCFPFEKITMQVGATDNPHCYALFTQAGLGRCLVTVLHGLLLQHLLEL